VGRRHVCRSKKSEPAPEISAAQRTVCGLAEFLGQFFEMFVHVFSLTEDSRHDAEERVLERCHFGQDNARTAVVRRNLVSPRADERSAVVAPFPERDDAARRFPR
jgi:hypothetical protein